MGETTETTEAETTATELAVQARFVNVRTGELLPATIENAAVVLEAAREMKTRITGVISEATAFVAEESRRLGTKTLPAAGSKVVLSGGPTIDYDTELLRAGLEAADCPEERINAAIKTTITYQPDRAVLRQLAGANPDYAAAIKAAEIAGYKNLSASVKPA